MFNRRGRGRPKLDHGKKKGGGVGKLKLTAQKNQRKRSDSPRRSGRNHDTSPPRPRSKSPIKSPSKPQARQGSRSPSKKLPKEKITSPQPAPAKGRPFKFKFSITEQVLCYEPDPTKAKVLYDSKVLNMAVNKNDKGKKFVEYLVHFQGWNSSWDRYVREDLILKDSDKNRQLQMELKEKANILKESLKKGKKSNADLLKNAAGQQNKDKGDKSDHKDTDNEESEDDDQESKAEILKKMVIPEDALMILDYDYMCIVEDKKLSILPAKKCVINILEDYIKESGLQMLRSWIEKRKQAIKDMMNLSKKKMSASIPTTSTSPQTITLPVYKKKTPIEISDEEFSKMILRLKFKIEFVDNIRILFDFLAGQNLMYLEEYGQFNKSKHIRCNPQHVYNQSFDKPEPEIIKEEPLQSKSKSKKKNSNEEAEISKGQGRGRKRKVTLVEPVKEKGKKKETSKSPSPKRHTRSSMASEPEILPSPKRRGPKPKFVKDNIKRENSPKPSTSAKARSSEPVFYTEIQSRNKTAPKVVYEVLTDRVKKLIDFIPLWSLLPKKMYSTLPCKPSLLYGVPHLLRLIVRIPSILEKMTHTRKRTETLVKHLNLLLGFIALKMTVDPTIYSFDGRKIRKISFYPEDHYDKYEEVEDNEEEEEEEEDDDDDDDDDDDNDNEEVELIDIMDMEEEVDENEEEDEDEEVEGEDEEVEGEDEEEEEDESVEEISDEEPEPVEEKIEPRRLRSRIKLEPVSD